ncbi:SAM-dependent methyltransferase [Methanobrevibacter sp. YE315]|uniref:class I SAM-dependent methyltransferase n=1 Tax=Methanobrevibacter sp. YE315 TaxID=1609968 RepID=UPI000764D2C5|nr:class I SAM-dependent methyltransferase [Methanobrevibacter sp. YE315]AMD17217.1 SAM-dependent methyltransferase [Methanobrevibacter sp. YE315]
MEIPLYFYLAYKDLDRLSPGSDDTTLKAIGKVNIIHPEDLNILDIACGVGSSTILLANYFENATVEAIDLFKHYLAVLDEKISENNLEDRVFTYQMDMNDPDFANEEFDIVFCEAAVEIMGFKKALHDWKRLLKNEGFLIVSDVSWIGKPSSESRKFWKETYEEIDTIENKIAQIKDEGYEFVDYVIVPKEDWSEYHKKLERNLNSLSSDKSAKEFVNQLKKEIKIYRQNSGDYSYVFYIMRKATRQ